MVAPRPDFARFRPSSCDWLKDLSLKWPTSLTSAATTFLPPADFFFFPPQPAPTSSSASADAEAPLEQRDRRRLRLHDDLDRALEQRILVRIEVAVLVVELVSARLAGL